ncbi:MAG: hypothetical protein U5O39_07540 [Gammaproteobacteria bacterium]|nr:hypothetical protein [Gammaproteobacteria bacterium]
MTTWTMYASSVVAVEGYAVAGGVSGDETTRWYATARASGVSEANSEKIRPAFLYEGFFY